jgi:hypothetical protein
MAVFMQPRLSATRPRAALHRGMMEGGVTQGRSDRALAWSTVHAP